MRITTKCLLTNSQPKPPEMGALFKVFNVQRRDKGGVAPQTHGFKRADYRPNSGAGCVTAYVYRRLQ